MASSVSSTTSTTATTATTDAAATEEESNFLAESQDYTVGSGFEFDSPDAQIADTMSGTSSTEAEEEVDVASNWGLAAAKPGQGRAQDRSAGRAHVDGESSVLFAGETEETEASSDTEQSTTGEETLSASSDAGSVGNWGGQNYNMEDMEYTV